MYPGIHEIQYVAWVVHPLHDKAHAKHTVPLKYVPYAQVHILPFTTNPGRHTVQLDPTPERVHGEHWLPLA